MSRTRRSVKTEHFVARTFFAVMLSLARARLSTFLIMHACVAQVCLSAIGLVMFGVVCPIAHRNTSLSMMSHPNLLGLHLGSFTSFCSTPLQQPQTIRPTLSERAALNGIGIHSSATPLEGQSGCLANSFPLTGYELKSCIDVGSEHTPINIPTRRNSFNNWGWRHHRSRSERELRQFAKASGSQGQLTTRPNRWSESLAQRPPVVRSQQETVAEWCVKHHQCWRNVFKRDKRSRSWKCANCVWKERFACEPRAESWPGCSRRMRSSETIIWSWSGNTKVGKEKFWYGSLRNQTRTWVSNIWSCVKLINGQIRLREKGLVYVESWKWETDYSMKVVQEIAKKKKLRNYEESVAKKQTEPDTWELKPLPTSASRQSHIQCCTQEHPWTSRREFASCQTRGRWATMASLRLYEKHGRLNDTWPLRHVRTRPRGLYFGRHGVPVSTESGVAISELIGEVSSESLFAATRHKM